MSTKTRAFIQTSKPFRAYSHWSTAQPSAGLLSAYQDHANTVQDTYTAGEAQSCIADTQQRISGGWDPCGGASMGLAGMSDPGDIEGEEDILKPCATCPVPGE